MCWSLFFNKVATLLTIVTARILGKLPPNPKTKPNLTHTLTLTGENFRPGQLSGYPQRGLCLLNSIQGFIEI